MGMKYKHAKQRMEASEPYFVHVGYTYTYELLKTRKKVKYRFLRLKTRPVVQARLDKLKRYWARGCK